MVTELMREMGLYSIRTQAKSNYEKWEKGKNRNLLKQQFHAECVNTIWVSDITYYNYRGQFYFICVVIDLYSRKVVACKISKRISSQLATATFKAACEKRKPPDGLIFHSDRGVQYTSKTFVSLLQQHGAKQSLSAPGKPHDNAVSESFFATLKKEELYRKSYTSEASFKKSVLDYIDFYNNNRPHAALNYKTPMQVDASAEPTVNPVLPLYSGAQNP